MAVSLGPFMTCFLAVLFLTVYIYIVIYVKKDILYSGMKLVFAGIALILIRMMIPFNFPFTQTIVSYKILPPVNKFLFDYIGDTKIDLATILFIIWIAVTLIKISRFVWEQQKYRAFLLPFAVKNWDENAQLEKVLKRCKVTFWRVCIVPMKVSPAVVGIRKPILVLPEYTFSDNELYYVCLHEAEHCRNHDLWLRLFLDIVICTQWFNPLVYFMQRELTLAFELSNDRVILDTMTERQKMEYAECVMKMVRHQNPKEKRIGTSLAFTHENRSSVKTRINYILNKKKRGNLATKVSMLLNCIVISIMLLVSLVFVPEAYCTDTLNSDDHLKINSENTYFLKKQNGEFLLFLDNQYIATFTEVSEEMSFIPIVEEEANNEDKTFIKYDYSF